MFGAHVPCKKMYGCLKAQSVRDIYLVPGPQAQRIYHQGETTHNPSAGANLQQGTHNTRSASRYCKHRNCGCWAAMSAQTNLWQWYCSKYARFLWRKRMCARKRRGIHLVRLTLWHDLEQEDVHFKQMPALIETGGLSCLQLLDRATCPVLAGSDYVLRDRVIPATGKKGGQRKCFALQGEV